MSSEKSIVNTLYHGAVVGGLALAYNQIGRMVIKGAPTRLEPTARDAGMLVLDTALGLWTRDYLVKQGIIPADIMK